MNEEFQQLYDYLRYPLELIKLNESNKKERIQREICSDDSIKVSKLIFETIGKDTFSSVMDMKYIEVTSYYGGGRDPSEIGRFYNKFWEFDIGIGNRGYISKITLKKEGIFPFAAAPADFKLKVQKISILCEWLEYFKGQCRMNGIEIKD